MTTRRDFLRGLLAVGAAATLQIPVTAVLPPEQRDLDAPMDGDTLNFVPVEILFLSSQGDVLARGKGEPARAGLSIVAFDVTRTGYVEWVSIRDRRTCEELFRKRGSEALNTACVNCGDEVRFTVGLVLS